MENVITRDTGRTRVNVRPQAVRLKPTRPWMQDFWLWILLVGPLVAPLFVALNIPLLQPFAAGIYLLGETVCPKVDIHLMFLGQPMAVCPSCWFSVFGLWTMRLLYGRAGEGLGPFSRVHLRAAWQRWQNTSVTTKAGVLALGFIPWAADVMLWDTGTWASPHAFMMLAGYIGGLAAGSLLLPVASAMRMRVQMAKIG